MQVTVFVVINGLNVQIQEIPGISCLALLRREAQIVTDLLC